MTIETDDITRSRAAPSRADSIELHVTRRAGADDHTEPVTCGVPLPSGYLSDVTRLSLHAPDGSPVPVQARVLDRWPDGSIRWVLLDWQAHAGTQATRYRLCITSPPTPAIAPDNPVRVERSGNAFRLTAGPMAIALQPGAPFPFGRLSVSREGKARLGLSSSLEVRWRDALPARPRIDRLEVEEEGPLRTCVRVEADLPLASNTSRRPRGSRRTLRCSARLHLHAGSGALRCDLWFHNPHAARHPGGLWDLGDAGSFRLRSIAWTLRHDATSSGWEQASLQYEPDGDLEPLSFPLVLLQHSSGEGDGNPGTHLRPDRARPQHRGFTLASGEVQRRGHRATPTLSLRTTSGAKLQVAYPRFWEAFPNGVRADSTSLTLDLLPEVPGLPDEELQGGERLARTVWLGCGEGAAENEALSWCHRRALVHAAPSWYARAQALPYLTPQEDARQEPYTRLAASAIEGPDSYLAKRERLDAFGWRHFGEVYGDHEAVFHTGPTPLVSHWNNQYDAILGCGAQFLRTADPRWWDLFCDMADHVKNIDTYRTLEDKAAYNGGIFWHTYHYVDADLANHRSYARRSGVAGGGPADEHNYTTGLLLHHLLTGCEDSRASVIDLADWVLRMDDGNLTVFRWLARGDTGLASATGDPLYHGPGRGAGNSINALLDAHRLTGDARYLRKAEQLIRRCVHPRTDIDALTLLDAERRWYYTVFLQALAKYLDHKEERGDLDRMYTYAHATLLHFARWMIEHERPYLAAPEILEYPTETWVAQDVRKSEVLRLAARHAASDEEAERLHAHADRMFAYVTTTLADMPAHSLCRPTVLLTVYGWLHAWFEGQERRAARAPEPTEPLEPLGPPERFVPQKVVALARAKRIAAAAAAALVLATAIGLAVLLR